jgi:hypothetical protein
MTYLTAQSFSRNKTTRSESGSPQARASAKRTSAGSGFATVSIVVPLNCDRCHVPERLESPRDARQNASLSATGQWDVGECRRETARVSRERLRYESFAQDESAPKQPDVNPRTGSSDHHTLTPKAPSTTAIPEHGCVARLDTLAVVSHILMNPARGGVRRRTSRRVRTNGRRINAIVGDKTRKSRGQRVPKRR